ncbi:probable serine/threonine-protein kinase DDB_G0271682 [Halichondria panicea]|uniref:probable serine/threonine-protein kinase DDB_G0271682 n=1 Tax=Halichondria panicea TaxID=6063 RepID=UPI00312BC1BB
MATSDDCVFCGVEWSSSPVTFHRNKGRNVKLTKSNTAATRMRDKDYGIVFTSEPMVAGQMLKVTMTEREECSLFGMDIGFTGENPEDLTWRKEHKHLSTRGTSLHCKDKELCRLGFDIHDFGVGDSLGMLLTLEKEVHWFVNDVWRGSVRVEDYPLDTPMWGVVDVYGRCKQVKAEICTVSKYNPDSERRLREIGVVRSDAQQLQREFWEVSPEEVSIREDEILVRGAWGYVAKGTFRGTTVAVKQVYPEILRQTTVDRIRREIRTMAKIRHPNFVLFVAAVLNEETGPMIVTELLDTSLCSAYQDNRVGPNKRRIFGDISSALVYLHRQREPIIHRYVSSANVLLLSLPNNKWLAKLSDFVSARDATTPGEGAILYTAPEAYPYPPTSSQPPPQQTTKIDVYSFGVLACEVVTRTFPTSELFLRLLSSMEGVWRELHPLITSCVSHSPQDRPSMDTVLHHIKQLDSEP